MKKHKSNESEFVYSTNPDFKPEPESSSDESGNLGPQNIRVFLDRLKGNKLVTRISGVTGNEDQISELGKELKQKCGTGGSVKDREILIQGDKRDQVLGLLLKKGIKAKKAGG